MNEMISQLTTFGVWISIVGYMIGVYLKKKLHIAIMNPLFVSILFVIGCLLLLDIDYATYEKGGQYLSFLLTPATVCLAIPLYEQLETLKNNRTAILAGVIAGVISSGISIYVLSLLFQLDHKSYVTLLPKSITTAIGMGVSEELGGYVTITVAVIIVTGILGNICAESVCKICKITDPVAKGIAIGSASHAIGTSKAMELGEVEGAMSSLSIVVTGLLTLVAANVFALFI